MTDAANKRAEELHQGGAPVNRWGVYGAVIGVASSIVALMLFVTLLGPGKAVAGAFKCDSHWLYEDDEHQLRAVAGAARWPRRCRATLR
jgi:hypothetical protein